MVGYALLLSVTAFVSARLVTDAYVDAYVLNIG